MTESMISAPPPMTVNFSEDFPGAGVRLVEQGWPARLLVDGRLIDMALRGETKAMSMSKESDDLNAPIILTFDLLNASAVYRQLPVSAYYLVRDIHEFDCVSCTRDLTDG